jgi:Raf kinase inhibitor-like YbhB/YbcL family protein
MKRILKHLLWIIPLIIVIVVISLVAYAATARRSDIRYHSKLQKRLQVSSNSFQDEQEMPTDFSCRGRAMAPNIQWTGAPAGTKSYALIAMDWDAPSPRLRLFPVVHWVLYNIPADTGEIPQNSTNASLTPRNIVSGLNISGQPGYMPPCPPVGTHRYEFRVYALDVGSIQPSTKDKAGVMSAMDGHILSYGELVGLKRP